MKAKLIQKFAVLQAAVMVLGLAASAGASPMIPVGPAQPTGPKHPIKHIPVYPIKVQHIVHVGHYCDHSHYSVKMLPPRCGYRVVNKYAYLHCGHKVLVKSFYVAL